MIRGTLIAALVGILSSVSQSQDLQTKPNTITVMGSVELREVADQASISFSVKGVGSSLREAVEHGSSMMESITKTLLGIGIPKGSISTSDFYSGENYGDKAFLSSSRDYRAVISAVIKVDSLRLVQPALFAIADAKVENVSGIVFTFKDELGLRRRARSAAAQKALEKAEDIATSLKASVGRVLVVEEVPITQTYRLQSYGARYERSSVAYPSPFNPISVPTVEKQDIDESRGSDAFYQTVVAQSQVRVTFELK